MIYFKYKIRKCSGYAKVSENSDIKKLKKLKIVGFSYEDSCDGCVYFGVEPKLHRFLKLSNLDDKLASYNIKFLNFMVARSNVISHNELEQEKYEQYNYGWFSSESNTYYEDEKTLQRAEYKDRIRNQNTQYKIKLKR